MQHHVIPCPAPSTWDAWALDELPQAEYKSLCDHVKHCERCRADSEHTARTVEQLRAVTPTPYSRDLTPDILALIPPDSWRVPTAEPTCRQTLTFSHCASRLLQVAAAALILIGATIALHRMRSSDTSRAAPPHAHIAQIEQGTDWLLAQQADAGGWDAKSLEGNPAYSPALNGLAILALTKAAPNRVTSQHVIHQAAMTVLKSQRENGQIGASFGGTMYNQAIASLALLEVYSITGEQELREPITKALAFMHTAQTKEGGWGYTGQYLQTPNTSITAWQLQAMMRADTLGLLQNRKSMERGLSWISGNVDSQGFFGYERMADGKQQVNTLTTAGAYCLLTAKALGIELNAALTSKVIGAVQTLSTADPEDYYESFLLTASLSAVDPTTCGGRLDSIRRKIVSQQQTIGNDTGAWLADDRWGRTGGRLYSTAMAVLALIP